VPAADSTSVAMMYKSRMADCAVLVILLPDQRLERQVLADQCAVPNEKITWGKLDVKTPNLLFESDCIDRGSVIFVACGLVNCCLKSLCI